METFSRLDSVLLLSSVNLPGGELVKKSLLFCSFFVFAYHFDNIFLAMFCITILKLLISQIIQKSFSHP